jgi:PAS domain S-box-containing protein
MDGEREHSMHEGSAPPSPAPRLRIPLAVTLTAPFALIITAAFALMGYLGIKNGFRAVDDLAGKLHGEIASMVKEDLDRYLGTPHLINALNADAAAAGTLDLGDSGLLAAHFISQIRRFPTVMSIAYADENAGYIGPVRSTPSGPFTLGVSGKSTGFVLTTYTVDDTGHRLEKMKESAPGYDPRTRPWYLAAVRAGKPVWTPIFMWSSGTVGLDAVMPVFEGSRLKGVLDVSLTLGGIGSYLRTLKAFDGGQAFIIERSGLLVASSAIEEPITRSADGFTRLPMAGSREPVIMGAAAVLDLLPGGVAGIRTPLRFSFDASGEKYLAQVTPYSDSVGLDWLFVSAIPERDFLSGIYSDMATMEWLVAVSLVVFIAIAALVARWTTRPILRLNESVRSLAHGSWSGKVAINRGDEIGDLARSFNAMYERLQAAFTSLTESEEKFRVLSEQSHIGVCIVQDGAPQYMNRTFRDATGWSEDSDMRKGFPDRIAEPPGISLIQAMDKLSREPESFIEVVQASDLSLRTRHGKVRWYSVFLKTVHLRGRPAGMAALVDITEERTEREKADRSQKQLIQAEKLASLGTLVAGVAHEINSPNQAIMLSSQVVKDAWPQLLEILEEHLREHGDFMVGGAWFTQMQEMIPNCLEAIGKCSGRIETIVTDLKDYARQEQSESFRAVDLNLVVTSALALTSAMLKKSTRNLTVQLAPEVPPVQGSFQRLEQVIVNLIQNACQALRIRPAECAWQPTSTSRRAGLSLRSRTRAAESQLRI